MGPERRVVKEWLKTVDREELDAMLQAAIFTPDELKYIRMRLIEGMTFKEIAIDQSLTRKSVARIARRISKKMYKQDEMGQLRGVTYGLADSTFSLNTTMLQGQAGLEKTVMQGNYSLGSQLAENRFAQQQCCCETNRNIDAVRAENYKNACEIKTAIHEEAERTRGLMMANQMQELRDKLADRDRALQSANFNLSQVVQNATIVGQLKPYPTPAYIVSSPYQSSTGGTTTTT